LVFQQKQVDPEWVQPEQVDLGWVQPALLMVEALPEMY
tara:strand:+ start:14434 stop:14547 length:114 start_codon:yes stop_codon:yes gene_type:complete